MPPRRAGEDHLPAASAVPLQRTRLEDVEDRAPAAMRA
jgi:hypothetical protein